MTGEGGARGVDFHNHVLPAVDDGAADLREGLEALRAFLEEGVDVVVATPHLPASLLERPEARESRLALFERAQVQLQDAIDLQELPVRLERGAEVRLDSPQPDFSDDRVRLAGTRFVLVEFSRFTMPPFGGRQLESVQRSGYAPVLAHPERYAGADTQLERFGRWRENGAFLQVNAGSLLGEYGERPRRVARALLERGWVDYLCSDYHARGAPGVAAAREALRRGRIPVDAEDLAEEEEDRASPAPVGDAAGGGEAPGGRGRGDEGAGPGLSGAGGGAARPEEGGGSGAPDDDADLERAIDLLTRTNAVRLLGGEDPLPVPPLVFGRGVWERVRSLLG